MKGSNIRSAEPRDAENLRQLFQMSIRRLCASHYTPEQIQRWTERPVEAFQGGTCLPAIKMEHLVYQPLVFAGDQSLADRVITSLACDGAGSRAKALRALKVQSPQEALDAIVSLLDHPEEKICRRAGGALTLFSKLRGEAVNVEQKADALAHYLEHSEDSRVRLSCALALGPVHSPSADRAFLRALADPFDKVVQWACCEVGERCGAEGTGAIKGLLNHSSWHVRLIACITLIQQKTADQRVVATLEALMREPEAAEHDAFEDEFKDFRKDLLAMCGGNESDCEGLGKMASLLEKARQIANRTGAEGQVN